MLKILLELELLPGKKVMSGHKLQNRQKPFQRIKQTLWRRPRDTGLCEQFVFVFVGS